MNLGHIFDRNSAATGRSIENSIIYETLSSAFDDY